MTRTMLVLAACASVLAGVAVAQDAPSDERALSTKPKALTTPNMQTGDSDGGVSVIPSGDGFLLAWHTNMNFNAGRAVFAHSFTAKGKSAAKIVKLRKVNAAVVGKPRMVQITSTKVAVVWEEETSFPQTRTIHGGVFNTKTNKMGTVKKLANTSGPQHDIVRMGNGNLALLSQMDNAGLADVTITTFDPALKKLKGPVTMGSYGATFQDGADYTTVDAMDGGFVIWRDRNANPMVLKLQKYNQALQLTGSPKTVNSSFMLAPNGNGTQASSVRAVRLTNNNFIVVWTHLANTDAGTTVDVRGRLFDSAGDPRGPDFLVNRDLAGTQYWPRVVALSKGAFAVVYLSQPDFGPMEHFVRAFNKDGSPNGKPQKTQGNLMVPNQTVETWAARLADGSLVHVFHDGNFGTNERVLGDGIPKSAVNDEKDAADE